MCGTMYGVTLVLATKVVALLGWLSRPHVTCVRQRWHFRIGRAAGITCEGIEWRASRYVWPSRAMKISRGAGTAYTTDAMVLARCEALVHFVGHRGESNMPFLKLPG